MNSFWLESVKRVLALAGNGLAYAENPYDIERYEELRRLGGEMFERLADSPVGTVTGLLDSKTGYQTLKVDVRGVRPPRGKSPPRSGEDRWLLGASGGWADVGFSPREVAVKGVREEAHLDAVPVRLLAVLDKKFHQHPPSPWHTYKLFLLCRIRLVGIEAWAEYEEAAIRERYFKGKFVVGEGPKTAGSEAERSA
jgi:ADP-ribose pyrophosphatase YjhB (NUDIX family)